MKVRILIAVVMAALIAIIAIQFHAPKTKSMPMPTTTLHWQNRTADSGAGGVSGIGGIGHPPRAGIEPLAPDKAEMSKIIHDSLKSKAADQKESGDW